MDHRGRFEPDKACYMVMAGICAATTPIFLRYSPEIHVYPLLLFATALAFLFASRVAFRPEQVLGYVGLAFSLALAVSTHLAGIMLVPPLCAFIAMATRDRESVRLDGALLAIVLPCLIFAFVWFVYLRSIGEVKRTWWTPPVSVKLAATMSESPFGVAALSWISTPFRERLPVLAFCVECCVKCLALAWLAEDARKPREGWREASGVLASQRRPNDLVVFYPAYAGIPVRFYLPGLPARTTMEIPIGGDPGALESKVHDKLAALDEDGVPAAIFLILRPDLRTLGDQDSCHRLPSALAAPRTRLSRPEKIIAVWAVATRGRPGAEYRTGAGGLVGI